MKTLHDLTNHLVAVLLLCAALVLSLLGVIGFALFLFPATRLVCCANWALGKGFINDIFEAQVKIHDKKAPPPSP
jgi:hypothetical protein